MFLSNQSIGRISGNPGVEDFGWDEIINIMSTTHNLKYNTIKYYTTNKVLRLIKSHLHTVIRYLGTYENKAILKLIRYLHARRKLMNG